MAEEKTLEQPASEPRSGGKTRHQPRELPVTVLFSDIKGYTGLTKKVSQEVLHHLLGEYLSRMTAIVQGNHGTIDKIMGDGILALFGAPTPVENHPYHACLAALEMLEVASSLSPRWRKANPGIDLEIRIGIATDHVLISDLENWGHSGVTALGDGVNLASRLQEKALPGTALVSRLTWDAINETLDCDPVRNLELKGFSDAYTAYQLKTWAPPEVQPQEEEERENEFGERLHQRRPIELEVRYKSMRGEEIGVTENVSEGGVFIATDSPNSVGEEIELLASAATERGTIPLTIIGRVVRHNYEGEKSGMGLQFVSITAHDSRAIHYFVSNVFQLDAFDRSVIEPTGVALETELIERYRKPTFHGVALEIPIESLASGDSSYFAKRLTHEFDRTQRYGHEFSCVAVRVDGLESLGTLEDSLSALQASAEALKSSLRTTDEVFYVNDGTFFLVAPETMTARVDTLTRRVVEAVHRIRMQDKRWQTLRVVANPFSFDGNNARSPLHLVEMCIAAVSA